jgi:hypothetical protein
MSKVIWIDKGWQPVYVGFCPNKKAWDTEMKKFGVDDPPEYPDSDGRTTIFVNDKSGDSMILVTLNYDENRELLEVIGLIAHEATHVFDYICEMIGEDEPSKEFKAYSNGITRRMG